MMKIIINGKLALLVVLFQSGVVRSATLPEIECQLLMSGEHFQADVLRKAWVENNFNELVLVNGGVYDCPCSKLSRVKGLGEGSVVKGRGDGAMVKGLGEGSLVKGRGDGAMVKGLGGGSLVKGRGDGAMVKGLGEGALVKGRGGDAIVKGLGDGSVVKGLGDSALVKGLGDKGWVKGMAGGLVCIKDDTNELGYRLKGFFTQKVRIYNGISILPY